MRPNYVLRGKIKLLKWSFKPPFFSPHKPPRIPDTSTRTTENYGRKMQGYFWSDLEKPNLKLKSNKIWAGQFVMLLYVKWCLAEFLVLHVNYKTSECLC